MLQLKDPDVPNQDPHSQINKNKISKNVRMAHWQTVCPTIAYMSTADILKDTTIMKKNISVKRMYVCVTEPLRFASSN